MYSDMFNLSWIEFDNVASNTFKQLLGEADFVDVTLVSDDLKQIKAHKVILSACSSIFKKMLQQNPQQQPIIYLTGVAYKEMQSMVNFMYLGQTEVEQDDLNHFMEVAAKFDVKGLSQEKQPDEARVEHKLEKTIETELKDENERELVLGKRRGMELESIFTEDVVSDIISQEIGPADKIPAGHLVEKCAIDNRLKQNEGTLLDIQKTEMVNLDDDDVALYEQENIVTPSTDSSEKAIHVQSSANLYSCDQCDYRSDRHYCIKIHKNARHDGIKFPCDQCEYKSTYSNALTRHKKNQHTN
eukprot:GFUD01017655.1.p1 GENE.GFUD01017655.1~~GFUD01017655.1.p1  ORF type:complete len:300 (+),score=87.50 GFUD01017655.1:37-936(+)